MVSTFKTMAFASIILSVLIFPSLLTIAYAQYLGSVGPGGETGQRTLEETLELAKRRIDAVQTNPAAGSGTPYLAADGVLGASAVAGAVFGGIAAALFFKARSGRYVAQGRG